jgi:hypothetical protein
MARKYAILAALVLATPVVAEDVIIEGNVQSKCWASL